MRGLRKYLTPLHRISQVRCLYYMNLAVLSSFAMPVVVPEISVDLMSQRWFESKSALFSAGLRDMDAILGRDDRLVAKLADAVTKLDAKFAAITGRRFRRYRNGLPCLKAYDGEKSGSADSDCGYGWNGIV